MNHRSLRSFAPWIAESQLEAFERFADALYAANEVINLTRVPREECDVRHFLDSLLFQDLIQAGARLLDIGTGPGFPAWPLACARPDIRVTAIDSSGKMLGFLRTQPLPNLEVALARGEEFTIREGFEIVTGRALAPLAAQLELSAAACMVGGRVIPMRTPGEDFARVRLGPLGLELREVVERTLGDTGVVRAFPIYVKTKRTDRRYPRRWSDIRRSPV